jgi:hypothetical protein
MDGRLDRSPDGKHSPTLILRHPIRGSPQEGRAMTELLVELLQPGRRTGVVDVGANPITDVPPYAPMLQKRIATLVGFEPQAEGLAALNLSKGDLETYLPYAVGDGKPGTLKLCHAPGMSSLLTPNPQVLDCLALDSIFGMVVGEVALDTRRLDDIAEIGALDFLKIDAGLGACGVPGRPREPRRRGGGADRSLLHADLQGPAAVRRH